VQVLCLQIRVSTDPVKEAMSKGGGIHLEVKDAALNTTYI